MYLQRLGIFSFFSQFGHRLNPAAAQIGPWIRQVSLLNFTHLTRSSQPTSFRLAVWFGATKSHHYLDLARINEQIARSETTLMQSRLSPVRDLKA